ncbi:MAG: zinc-binding dehydrogenase [Ilumatobacteraceae bacterium]|nr:zinc-binding dehydrogenase [Ilumatobacteraceae bacterium]
MKALFIDRSVARLGAARIAAGWSASAATRLGPLTYGEIDEPELHGDGWHRVHTRLSGICGSDLSMIEGHASTYFDEWVSFPFVPGHEVVGQLDDGTRVVLEPVLGHEARGLPAPFDGAAPGDGDDYAHLATGALEPGIQTGFCCSTGGGWAPWFVAHDSQLHRIPDDMPDERAVLVEPVAGGVHAALLAAPTVAHHADDSRPPVVAVIGAGTMGLTTIAGLRRYLPDVRIVVGARHPHQKSLARQFGADVVVEPDGLARAVRRAVGCHVIGDYLSSGADVTIDAVGTSATLTEALHMTRPRGRVIMLGMPASVTVDLTGLWHRETELKGAYTYGTESLPDGSQRRTFELAIDTANDLRVEQMFSAAYPLADHLDAIAHAAEAGRRGATKICFEVREGI